MLETISHLRVNALPNPKRKTPGKTIQVSHKRQHANLIKQHYGNILKQHKSTSNTTKQTN